MAIASSVRQQQRTVERERSIYAFRKEANLVERTWYDNLRAMPELSGCPSATKILRVCLEKISAFGTGPVRCPGAISILSGYATNVRVEFSAFVTNADRTTLAGDGWVTMRCQCGG